MPIGDNQPYSYTDDNGVTIHVWFDQNGQRHENAAGVVFVNVPSTSIQQHEQDYRTEFLDEAIAKRQTMTDEQWSEWIVPKLRLMESKDLVIIAARAIGALA